MCALAAEQLLFGAKVAAVAQRGSRRSVAGCRALREPILIGSASELILLSVYYLLEFLDDRQVSPHPLEPAPLPPLPPPELTHDRGSILACSRVCVAATMARAEGEGGRGRARAERAMAAAAAPAAMGGEATAMAATIITTTITTITSHRRPWRRQPQRRARCVSALSVLVCVEWCAGVLPGIAPHGA